MKQLLFIINIFFSQTLVAMVIDNQTSREIIFQLEYSNRTLSHILKIPAKTCINDPLKEHESVRAFIPRDVGYSIGSPYKDHTEYLLPSSEYMPTLMLYECHDGLHVYFKTEDELLEYSQFQHKSLLECAKTYIFHALNSLRAIR